MKPVEYLSHPACEGLFEAAGVYKKRETTALRLPAPSEIGRSRATYKADPTAAAGYSRESEAVVEAGSVIARNSNLVLGRDGSGSPVYNEWVIPRSTVEKNYGAEVLAGLGAAFQEHRKKASVKAVELTGALLAALGAEPNAPLPIKVSWSAEPMIAHEGDFLTDQGYSIAAANMRDYDRVG